MSSKGRFVGSPPVVGPFAGGSGSASPFAGASSAFPFATATGPAGPAPVARSVPELEDDRLVGVLPLGRGGVLLRVLASADDLGQQSSPRVRAAVVSESERAAAARADFPALLREREWSGSVLSGDLDSDSVFGEGLRLLLKGEPGRDPSAYQAALALLEQARSRALRQALSLAVMAMQRRLTPEEVSSAVAEASIRDVLEQ